ncbi:bifunctional DNA primase/polymerase [Pseudomonas nitroreducens]|uniref:DNA primase/polymerase bifunctional N-terminal domain-containing protein n=1 Tax=Pseudomonas nitroreducens TaxID=46680 RepID=A0A6G6IY60_PSENT|nr:bifunctional DNA primase/polymerase [Pseudomonas nitroreducens]QIE87999.1 hypothetical protein G5B91_17645 [Pseudomonas nitroreducens]
MAAVIQLADSPKVAALAYARMGWHVFPCWPIRDGACACGKPCKSPGKHPIGHLVPHGQEAATLDPEVIAQWWAAVPDANIAVHMAKSSLVAIDIDPRNGGLFTIEQVEAQHGDLVSDVLAFTGGGGEHRVFALPANLAGSLPGTLGKGVDVKVNGYIMVAPSNHISGSNYEWEVSSSPLDGACPSPMPNWLRDLFRASAKAPEQLAAAENKLTEDLAEDLRSALQFINGESRDSWYRVGMALHSTGDYQWAFDTWSDWSRQWAHKFDPVDQVRVWRSFKNKGLDGLSHAVIFADAQANGWENPRAAKPELRPVDDAYLAELAVLNGEKRKVITELGKREVLPFPVPGLDAVAEWIGHVTGARHGIAIQMAAISVAALAASRLFESSMGDGCHLNQLVSAQSYSEVGPIMNAVGRIFHDAGLRKLLREQRISSPSGFFKTLHRSPASLYLAAEWGRKFFGPQFSAVEHVGILIGQGFNKQVWVLDAPEEAGLKKSELEDDQPVIHKPAFNLLAFAASSDLANVFSEAQSGRGLIETLLFSRVETDFDSDPRSEVTPEWLINHVRRVRGLPTGANELDLVTVFNGNAGLIPTLKPVIFQAQPAEHYAAIDALSSHRNMRPILHGARILLRRLACTLAAWGNPDSPIVTRDILDWAAQFVLGSTFEVLQAMKLGSSEEGRSTAYEKTLAAITKAGPQGIKLGYLQRSCWTYRNLDNDARGKLIDQLIDDGEIIRHPEISGHYVSADLIKVEVE